MATRHGPAASMPEPGDSVPGGASPLAPLGKALRGLGGPWDSASAGQAAQRALQALGSAVGAHVAEALGQAEARLREHAMRLQHAGAAAAGAAAAAHAGTIAGMAAPRGHRAADSSDTGQSLDWQRFCFARLASVLPSPERESPGAGKLGEGRQLAWSDARDRDTRDKQHPDIVALYVSSSRHYVPDLFTSGYSFRPWTEYWAVLSTGEVYLGLPHGDPRTFDYEEERRKNPHRFVELQPIVDADELGFEYAGHMVHLNTSKSLVPVSTGVVFRKVEPCDGCRVQGEFKHDAPRDYVESSESLGMHKATSISFTKDGAYCIHGCTDVCFRESADESAQPGDSDVVPVRTCGSYKVTGNIIEFRSDEGVVEDAYFFKYPCCGDDLLSINGIKYKREPDPPSP